MSQGKGPIECSSLLPRRLAIRDASKPERSNRETSARLVGCCAAQTARGMDEPNGVPRTLPLAGVRT